jgi:hypothetical protein
VSGFLTPGALSSAPSAERMRTPFLSLHEVEAGFAAAALTD